MYDKAVLGPKDTASAVPEAPTTPNIPHNPVPYDPTQSPCSHPKDVKDKRFAWIPVSSTPTKTVTIPNIKGFTPQGAPIFGAPTVVVVPGTITFELVVRVEFCDSSSAEYSTGYTVTGSYTDTQLANIIKNDAKAQAALDDVDSKIASIRDTYQPPETTISDMFTEIVSDAEHQAEESIRQTAAMLHADAMSRTYDDAVNGQQQSTYSNFLYTTSEQDTILVRSPRYGVLDISPGTIVKGSDLYIYGVSATGEWGESDPEDTFVITGVSIDLHKPRPGGFDYQGDWYEAFPGWVYFTEASN